MKKMILITAMVVAFSFTGSAIAQDKTNGDPFRTIWKAINDLKRQIASIQLTPGPQGPKGDKGDTGNTGERGESGPQGNQGERGLSGADGKDGISCWDLNGNGIGESEEDTNTDGNYDALDCAGSRGEKGEKGERGPTGESGKRYTLKDGNNIVLGTVMSRVTNNGTSVVGFEVFDDARGVFVSYSQGNEREDVKISLVNDIASSKIYFELPGCLGRVYSPNLDIGYYAPVVSYNDRLFRVDLNTNRDVYVYQSLMTSVDSCSNLATPKDGRLQPMVEESKFPIPKWPLKMVVE